MLRGIYLITQTPLLEKEGNGAVSKPSHSLTLNGSSLRRAEKIIRCLQDDPPEAKRVILLVGQEFPDGFGGSGTVVAAQSRIHPTGRKENVARSLNFDQQIERRLNVLLRLCGSERMVDILQAFENPWLT